MSSQSNFPDIEELSLENGNSSQMLGKLQTFHEHVFPAFLSPSSDEDPNNRRGNEWEAFVHEVLSNRLDSESYRVVFNFKIKKDGKECEQDTIIFRLHDRKLLALELKAVSQENFHNEQSRGRGQAARVNGHKFNPTGSDRELELRCSVGVVFDNRSNTLQDDQASDCFLLTVQNTPAFLSWIDGRLDAAEGECPEAVDFIVNLAQNKLVIRPDDKKKLGIPDDWISKKQFPKKLKAGPQNIVIKGLAGTGKTICALSAVHDKRGSTLFVCVTVSLREWARSQGYNARTSAEVRLIGLATHDYSHVVFDEFQDYTPELQNGILTSSLPWKAWILFDPNQCVHPTNQPTFDNWETHTLEFCMRNTQEIAKQWHSSTISQYKLHPTLPRGFPVIYDPPSNILVNYIKNSQRSSITWRVLLGYSHRIQNRKGEFRDHAIDWFRKQGVDLEVSFVKEFAGLEADAVVYVEVKKFDPRIPYTAYSRARTLVVTMSFRLFWPYEV